MRHLEPTFRLHLADDDEPQDSQLRPVRFSELVGDALAEHAQQLRDRQRLQQQPETVTRVRCRDLRIINAHGRKHGIRDCVARRRKDGGA